jgi:hypothetical protein
MASIEDIQTLKLVKREFNRRQIDTTKADIKVFRGVVHVRGTILPLGSGVIDAKKEVQAITRGLRAYSSIRDVVLEVKFAS